MRKKDESLRGTLLACARKLAQENGLDAINIRSIAKEAGIASGTVYNYFAGKEEILLALTEEHWQEILFGMHAVSQTESLCKQLEEIYAYLRAHMEGSAGALMASLAGVGRIGQTRMLALQRNLAQVLIQRMEGDQRIRKEIWTASFCKEQFAEFLTVNLTWLLRTRAESAGFLIEVVKQTIYEK